MGGPRGLDAAGRDKLFDATAQTSPDKSQDLQRKKREGVGDPEAMDVAKAAKYWTDATSCVMHLQHANPAPDADGPFGECLKNRPVFAKNR